MNLENKILNRATSSDQPIEDLRPGAHLSRRQIYEVPRPLAKLIENGFPPAVGPGFEQYPNIAQRHTSEGFSLSDLISKRELPPSDRFYVNLSSDNYEGLSVPAERLDEVTAPLSGRSYTIVSPMTDGTMTVPYVFVTEEKGGIWLFEQTPQPIEPTSPSLGAATNLLTKLSVRLGLAGEQIRHRIESCEYLGSKAEMLDDLNGFLTRANISFDGEIQSIRTTTPLTITRLSLEELEADINRLPPISAYFSTSSLDTLIVMDRGVFGRSA